MKHTKIKNFCPFNFNKIESKRGQGLSVNAIILIILAIVVLVILILGFTMGWETLLPWIKTHNIDTIAQSCAIACSQGNTYDFCTLPRTVKDGTNPEFESTCYLLATSADYAGRNYGIETCDAITCFE